MKAALTRHYGSAHVLATAEVPRPTLRDDQVLVEVHATPVTAGDLRLRAADFPGVSAVPGRLMFGLFRPRIPVQGSMFAGRIVEVGAKVTRYAVGDDVFGSTDNGAYAEYLAVAEDGSMAKMPAGLGYDDAAALPYGAGTALHFLRDLGGVTAGDKVLILGASGGVGRLAIQIAKHLGAEVTAVSSARGHELVRELGADHVLDYTREDFRQNGVRYDVIFDIAGATSFRQAKASLTAKGRYLTVFMTVDALVQMAWTRLRGGPQASTGVALGSRESMEEVAALAEQGAISAVIGARFGLEDIVEAHTAAGAAGGASLGTVIVEPVGPVAPRPVRAVA